MSSTFNPPNLFGPIGQAYQQGAMAPYIGPMAQQQMQQGQQQLQTGQLNIEQLRMALAFNAWKNQKIQEAYNSTPSITPQNGSQSMGAQSTGGPSQGVVNGPQGAVGSRALTSTDSSMPSSSAGSGTPSPSGSYDGSISSGPWMPSVDPGQLPMDSIARQHLGMLAPEMLKGLTEGESSALNHAQIMAHLPGSPLTMLESFAQNPQAGQALLNNPQYLGQWPQIARQFGANPQDLSDINVRRVATLAANQARSGLKEGPLAMPEHFTQQGAGYGGNVNINDMTGQQTPGLPREIPTTEYKEITDPNDPIRTVLQPVVTRGLAPNAGITPGPGDNAAPTKPLSFFKTPTQDESKAAQFADYYHQAIGPLRTLEDQGIRLSPAPRATIINAAVSDSDGLTGEYARQIALKYALSPQDQEYMAALMPLLQSMGHSMAGMRLTASQMRTNFESLIPQQNSDPAALQTINNSRNTFYKGLLSQAGTAIQLPQYKSTLGADLAGMSNPTKTIAGKTYTKMNGKWYGE